MEYKILIEKAIKAREMAYAPYSHYCVGAALLTSDDNIFTGCNIECSTFSPTNCAERTALFKAISEGYRQFKAIAIVGGKQNENLEFCTPCGVCRQALCEFTNPEHFDVVMLKDNEICIMKLSQLLPYSFGPHNLK